jgi:hypothetical protein
VNETLRRAWGPQVACMSAKEAVRRGDGDHCLLLQALFAFVSNKDGLSEGVAVGDELDLWFKAQKPKPDKGG